MTTNDNDGPSALRQQIRRGTREASQGAPDEIRSAHSPGAVDQRRAHACAHCGTAFARADRRREHEAVCRDGKARKGVKVEQEYHSDEDY